MAQSLITLLFAIALVAAVATIIGTIADSVDKILRAFGFEHAAGLVSARSVPRVVRSPARHRVIA